METNQLAGLLGQGGIAAALIWVIYKVGISMVEAVKGLREEISAHTKQDLAAQSEVREELIALSTRLDIAHDVTPIRGISKVRAATEPGRGGFYGPRKPAREDE